MLQIDEQTWVVLGRVGARLALQRSSERDDVYVEGAFGAVLRLDCGDVQLQRTCSIEYVESFCRAVEGIYRDLSGDTELSTFDDLSIRVSAGPMGAVDVRIESGDVGPVTYQLKISFQLDQTYLPPFVRRLRAEFPSKVAT
jgi:hypothetical protein